PMGVVVRRPYLLEAGGYGFAADVARPGHVGTGARLEDAVLRHHRHDACDVVTVPSRGEILEKLDGATCRQLFHEPDPPSLRACSSCRQRRESWGGWPSHAAEARGRR